MQHNLSAPSQQRHQNGTAQIGHDLEALVEQIWREVNGQASRTRIHEVVTLVAADFEQATIRAFVPIFIRRNTVELLRLELMPVDAKIT